MAVISEIQSYMLPVFVRSTGRWKVRITPFTSLGGVLSASISWTPFSRRTRLFPAYTPSVQLMVTFPSTAVTTPTGSMVTVWATEMPNIAKGTDKENQLKQDIPN